MVEQDRAEAILSAALDDLLEEVYGSLDEHPDRRALAESFGAGRDDRTLPELILRLHSAVQSHPHPGEWLREKRAALRALLQADPYPDFETLAALDREYMAENLSPGGSADLLALCWLLHFLKEDS